MIPAQFLIFQDERLADARIPAGLAGIMRMKALFYVYRYSHIQRFIAAFQDIQPPGFFVINGPIPAPCYSLDACLFF